MIKIVDDKLNYVEIWDDDDKYYLKVDFWWLYDWVAKNCNLVMPYDYHITPDIDWSGVQHISVTDYIIDYITDEELKEFIKSII